MVNTRTKALEAALLDYVARYGLTPLARQALRVDQEEMAEMETSLVQLPAGRHLGERSKI